MGMTDNIPWVLDWNEARQPVLVIAGPTASGKSGYAVRLAQAIVHAGRRAVIINADSAQVYADLSIVSARPTEAEMGGIAHRLYGKWDGAVPCNAADWAATARQEIAALHKVGAVPILVGGTGMYLSTLIDGIAPVPPIDPTIREAVRAMPQAEARAALEREDPRAAARLAPADRARTARALETVRSTGKPLHVWQAERTGGIAPFCDIRTELIMPERGSLYAACDLRFAQIIELGQDEVARLLSRKLSPNLPVMRAIGVPEIAALLRGELSRPDALAAGQLSTRRYAKRQYTWFRHQPRPTWRVAPHYSDSSTPD